MKKYKKISEYAEPKLTLIIKNLISKYKYETLTFILNICHL